MNNLLLLFFLIVVTNAQAQSWIKLAYSPDQPGIEENPLKGFADLYGPQNDFPRSINGKLFGLNQVMFGLDEFNWGVIDDFVETNKREGNFSYLQVNIDPGPDQNNRPRSYMPGFLDGQYESVTVDGPVADICPDWNDPEVIEAMLSFIDGFGARYDTLPEVFMISLGLYGIYGEWQIGDAEDIAPEFEMTNENKTLIANAFRAAFPNTYLLARYPESMPDPELFGYSDGLYFSQSISNNVFFDHFYFNNTIDLYNAGQNWRNQLIAGEIDPCIQPTIWRNWPNDTAVSCDPNNPSGQNVTVQDVTGSIQATHPSFLFTHHVFTALDPVTTADEWNNAIRAQKLMGYTLYVEEYRVAASSGFPAIEVNIQNRGVAPMYANWDIEFGAINNATQEFQLLGAKKWDLQIIQPDVPDHYRSFVGETALTDGDYTFLLRVVNPLEASSAAASPVRFANETQDSDRDGWLTLGRVEITDGQSGTMPIAATSLNLSKTGTTLSVGDALLLSTAVGPEEATDKTVTWLSSEPGTATVDRNGRITAGPAYGAATITAYTQGSDVMAECALMVEPRSVAIPGTIEGEDYIRMNGIVPGFGKLGFIDDRDWMDYSVSVDESANFIIFLSVSCPDCVDNQSQVQDNGVINILDEDGNLLDEIRLPKTSSFNDFEAVASQLISLDEGVHRIRIEAKKGRFDLDKLEFVLDSLVGIATFVDSELRIIISPNPTNGQLSINLGQGIEPRSLVTLELFDIYGNRTATFSVKDTSLDVSQLPSGVYFLILNIDGNRVGQKLVKY